MITPTVGRVVWVRNRPGRFDEGQPEAALVCYVHGDRLVNVAGFDANGEPFKLSSLPLKQGDEGDAALVSYHGPYAEWMPYQKGQAAKTEALEKQVAGAPLA